MNAFMWLQEVLLVLVAVLMLVTDLWKKAIPDWINYPTIAGGWLLHGLEFGIGDIWDFGLLTSILGTALGGLVFGPFYWAGKRIGAGDVKAAMAIGSLTGFFHGLTCFVCITLSGSFLALVHLLGKRMGRFSGSRVRAIAYGPAILIGVCWSLLIRHGVFPLFP